MGFCDFFHAEYFGIKWSDVGGADEVEQPINGLRSGKVTKEPREINAIGDVFDGVKILHGENVSQHTCVANVAGTRNTEQRVAQCLWPDELDHFVGNYL